MKSDFLEFIGSAPPHNSQKFRNQFYVFLVCLVLSVFIWSLVRLSKDYYYSIEYHLRFAQLPSNLKMVACSDSTLNIKIKLQGFDFFSEQLILQQHREYEVSLRNVRIRYLGEHTLGYLLTNRIGKEIIAQTNFPNDVYFVSPDTLFFEFEKQTLKRLAPYGPTNAIRMEIRGKDTLLHRTDTMVKHLNRNKGNNQK
jgi:hypothetical protein